MNLRLESKEIEIDFGVGKIKVLIEPISSVATHELVQAIKNAAMLVPLPELIKKIESCNGYPRF